MEEKEKISERGAKSKAGRLLSQYIRAIAKEIYTTEGDEAPQTKAEALARILWDKALGGDRKAAELILDRMEGKVGTSGNHKPPNRFPISGKVSDEGKNRLNDLTNGE